MLHVVMKGGRVGGSRIQTHCWHTHGWRAGTSADAKRCLHCSAPSLSLPPSPVLTLSLSVCLTVSFPQLSLSPSLLPPSSFSLHLPPPVTVSILALLLLRLRLILQTLICVD